MPGWGAWASLWGIESYQQGYEPLAKQDTLYLGIDDGGGIADLATDLSQYLDNQTTAATWHYEPAPATRFNVLTEWTIEADFTANNASTGRIWTQGTSGRFRISIAAGVISVTLQAAAGFVTVATLAMPGVAAGNERFVVSWAVQANPLTTGAADACRTELRIWNVTDGSYDATTALHRARDTETGAAVWWAGSTAGTNPFSGTPHACRFGERFISASETYSDFVATVSAPTTEVDTTAKHEGLPATTLTAIHGRDNFHGPAALWAADKSKRLQRRTLTPLYNKRFKSHPTWTDALLTASNPKIRAAPGDSDYRMHISWLQVAPVPETCSHLWVRCHVFSRASAGDAVPVGVRFFSMNGLPGDPGFESFSATEVITRDDEVGVTFGEWDVESLVPISRDPEGNTYLAIALCVDPASASANDANAQIVVRSCHAVPCFKSTQGGFPMAP
jgi:hypothetical protein